MKIASFDIGIKNMAYCIFECSTLEKTWSVLDWNVLNLMNTSDESSASTPKRICGHVSHTSRKCCGKKAKYYKENSSNPDEPVAFCEKHAKTQSIYLIPAKEYTLAHLRKQKVNYIVELYKKCELHLRRPPDDSPPGMSNYQGTINDGTLPRKMEMMEAIAKYYNSRLFSEICVPKKNANDANLIQIGWAIRRLLDECSYFTEITHVVIENQISPIASRMKTIQGMLAQYFIMKSTLENPIEIVFVSSSNKLRIVKTPDNSAAAPSSKEDHPLSNTSTKSHPKYQQNKKDGVSHCSQYILINPPLAKWSGAMNVSKKDDLADCFLQGIWFLSNRNIITCAENLKINIV